MEAVQNLALSRTGPRNDHSPLWPEVATLAVVFLLYSNAPAVAVKFHGVPFIVGAMVVLPLVIPFIYYVVLRRQPLIVAPALPFILLFLMVATASSMLSRDPGVSQSTVVEECQGVALCLLISNVVRSAATLRRVIWMLLLAGSLLGSISLHQQLTKSYTKNYGGFGQVLNDGFKVDTAHGVVSQPRLSGPMGEKNRYAQIMIMLVPLGFMLYLGERALWARALAILATTLTTLGFAMAFSRGAAVGFALALGLATLMGYIKPRQLVIACLAAVLLLAAFPQYRARLGSLKTLASAMSETQDSDEQLDGAIKGRFTEMLAAARVFADYPLTGVGPGMFRYYAQEYGNEGGLRLLETEREAHSLYLGIAADMGAPGILCFLGMVWVTLRSLARVRKRCLTTDPRLANLATGFILSIVTFLAAGLNSHFSYTRYYWLVLGLATATACLPAVSTVGEHAVQRKPPARAGEM
jgi:putative inorganic carbon (HCO3(-)) transporter